MEDMPAEEEEDVVEDFSDAEGPPPPPPAPLTPPGAAGRFADYLGIQRSGAKAADGTSPPEPKEPETFPREAPASVKPKNLFADAAHHAETVGETEADAQVAQTWRTTEDGVLVGLGQEQDGGESGEAPVGARLPKLAPAEARAAGESDASDAEGSMEEALPPEPWAGRPAEECELWAKAQPRSIRLEAQKVRRLRFPATVVGRVARLHPELQGAQAAALESINHASVLLLEALAHMTARGKLKGQRISLEDVRLACQSVRELGFMHPVNSTLDASALFRHGDGAPVGSAEGGRGPTLADPGQRLLNAFRIPGAAKASAFDRLPEVEVASVPHQQPEAPDRYEENAGRQVEAEKPPPPGPVQRGLDFVFGRTATPAHLAEQLTTPAERPGEKRKAPPSSGQKAAGKVAKKSAAPSGKKSQASVGPGFAGLFGRVGGGA